MGVERAPRASRHRRFETALSTEFRKFDARSERNIGVKRCDRRIRVFELRSCSISEALKVDDRDSSSKETIAQFFKEKERAFGGGLVAPTPACFTLERDERAERGRRRGRRRSARRGGAGRFSEPKVAVAAFRPSRPPRGLGAACAARSRDANHPYTDQFFTRTIIAAALRFR
jgi:hypothetical protein